MYGAEGIAMSAKADGSDFRLSGTKLLVPYAHAADTILCVARTESGGDPTAGVTLFLVEKDARGVTLEPLENIAGYKLFAVTFDDVKVSEEGILGKPGAGWQPFSMVLDRAAILQCGEIVGAAQRIRDMNVNYAKERVQFGRPIGQFQAVQWMVSEIALDAHFADLLSRQAAWRIDEGLPYEREVAIAKAHASRAISQIVVQGQEVHAGVAFMLEHDMQMFTRRAKHWEYNLGDARFYQERLAVEMGL